MQTSWSGYHLQQSDGEETCLGNVLILCGLGGIYKLMAVCIYRDTAFTDIEGGWLKAWPRLNICQTPVDTARQSFAWKAPICIRQLAKCFSFPFFFSFSFSFLTCFLWHKTSSNRYVSSWLGCLTSRLYYRAECPGNVNYS